MQVNSNKINQKLIKLCCTNCTNQHAIKQIQQLLQKGADPNSQIKDSTPLCEACRHGNIQIVIFLLQHGASADIKDRHGSSPLHIAIAEGKSHLVSLLLKHRANVHVRDNKGRFPLTEAYDRRSDFAIRLLIDNGANVNIGLPYLRLLFPLQFLPNNGGIELTHLMLNAGASPFQYRRESIGQQYFDGVIDYGHPCWLLIVRTWVAAGFPIDVWLRMASIVRDTLSISHSYSQLNMSNYEQNLGALCKLEECIKVLRGSLPCLQLSCRTRIRHELVFSKTRGHIRQKIDELFLPKRLKTFLKLDDFQCENDGCKCNEIRYIISSEYTGCI